MTATETLTIPLEFRATLDVSPDDFILRLVIADYFAERGETLCEEAMRWSVEKGRVPAKHPGGYNWWYWNERRRPYLEACWLPDDMRPFIQFRKGQPTDQSRSISTTFDQVLTA